MEVYGLPFSSLVLTQFSYSVGVYSPFWLEIVPSVNIEITHQLIIEFPTLSNDGVSKMFDDDLGWSNLEDGDWIPTDVYDCAFTNSYLSCRLFYGDSTRGMPAKIICGKF